MLSLISRDVLDPMLRGTEVGKKKKREKRSAAVSKWDRRKKREVCAQCNGHQAKRKKGTRESGQLGIPIIVLLCFANI